MLVIKPHKMPTLVIHLHTKKVVDKFSTARYSLSLSRMKRLLRNHKEPQSYSIEVILRVKVHLLLV